MKIRRLELKAYGHFTDRTLEFSSETPGLHIIFGPNEAGKSTSLRALKGLLYGIPTRTADNFLHDYNKLLIGGCVENLDGKELTFWRRKKNVGDLQGADLKIIDQGVLAEFLHGIEAPLFNALFGIDHETLVSGGRDILEQKGDIGQSLFSAGAGLSSLHGIIEALEKEYGDLFKPGGSKPELNQAIKTYQDLKKEIRDLSLPSSAWKEQKEIFESASGALGKIEEEKFAVRSEMERLKRLQRAMTHLVNRVALAERLAALGDLGHLPMDFSSRVQDAFGKQKEALRELQDANSRQTHLTAKISDCSVRQDILDQAETIDALHQDLGVQRQAQKDRPGLQAQLVECRAEAEILLNLVAPALKVSQSDEIKTLLARRQSISTLGNQFAGLELGLTKANQQAKKIASGLAGVQSELESLPVVADLSGLSAAVTAAQKAGDLDGTVRKLDREVRALLDESESALKRIGLWAGTPEELLTLPLPPLETIDRFVESYREMKEAERTTHQQQKDVQGELDRVRRDLGVMEKTGTVATEDDLSRARDHRDRGWQLIRRVWLGGEELPQERSAYDETKDLPDAFEAGMRTADEVSDHLRSAAERVHQYASLLAEAEKLEGQKQRLMDEAKDNADRKVQIELEWQAVWSECGLQPRSPFEMRGWVEQSQDIRRSIQEAKKKQSEKQPHLLQRESLRKGVVEELLQLKRVKSFAGEELTPVLTYAEQVLTELKGIQDQRTSLQKDQRRLAKEDEAVKAVLRDSQAKMFAWREQWSAALSGFGLPEDARPDEAAEALDKLRISLEKSSQSSGYDLRIKEIDRHADEFDASVKALVRSVAPELDGLPADQAVVKLQALLKDAEAATSLQQQLSTDLEDIEEEIRQAKVGFEGAKQELSTLRELARCDTDEALSEVAGRFTARLEAKKELAQVEETLVGIAEGVALDDLESQRQGVDPNELPGQIEALNRQLEDDLEPQIKILSEKRGEAGNELQRMDGSGKAAAKEDEAQAALAKVRRLADRYIRVRMAALLLKKEIDRYRQEHQDPILKIATRYFSELTLGAFPGLRSDVDDHGQPILVSVCPDGSTKTVEEMSSGTRDQLYLALRLATLEWRLEKHEPMPFIADDILVNFDDARSEATLKALAALAEKNQVILFTHHQKVVEAAQGLGLNDSVFVHPLGSSAQTI